MGRLQSDRHAINLERARGLLLRPTEQPVIAGCVLFGITAMVVYFIQQGGLRQRVIEIERVNSSNVSFQLDINAAPWPELTLLPGVGETLARRIVAERHLNGRFAETEHLMRVEGIGPKTIEQIRPYLLPTDHNLPVNLNLE